MTNNDNDFPYHAYPIDIYRFMKEAPTVFVKLTNSEMLDML
jgi:hypothetical protein